VKTLLEPPTRFHTASLAPPKKERVRSADSFSPLLAAGPPDDAGCAAAWPGQAPALQTRRRSPRRCGMHSTPLFLSPEELSPHKLLDPKCGGRFKSLLLSASDDFVLQRFGQIAEVVTIAGDPHDEVAIFLRIGLGGSQGIRRNDVELNVVTVQLEVRPDQVGKAIEALLIFQQLGCELLVQQRSPGAGMVHLRGRLQYCRWPTTTEFPCRAKASRFPTISSCTMRDTVLPVKRHSARLRHQPLC